MNTKVLHVDESHIVLLPAEGFSVGEEFDPKYAIRGGLEIIVDHTDDEPITIEFVLAKDEEDTLGPDFTEHRTLPDDRLSTYVLTVLKRYDRVLKPFYPISLSAVILANEEERLEELDQALSHWLAEFIAANFTFTAVMKHDTKRPDRVKIILTTVFTRTDESEQFEFETSLRELVDQALSPEEIDSYFGLVIT